ncbi:hypothetical protein NMG60_11029535 [Bertholletia excelsa]
MAASICKARLVMLVVAVVVVGISSRGARGQCQGDLPGLMAECPRYVGKAGPEVVPSRECCNVVRSVDVECACQYITKEVEQIISMEKVVFVAKSCGKPLPHGSKCGSYTVP